MDEKFVKVKENRIQNRDKIATRLARYKEKLSKAQPGTREHDAYSQIVRDGERSLRCADDIIEFMRPDNEEDLKKRVALRANYHKVIKEVVPDGMPIVFHGTSNVGTVREILKTGGLLTPDQRGVTMTSFASLIDATYKDNIRVSCEYADTGAYMPYGAIFAFIPEKEEVANVIRTGDSSEVAGGVNGVNFRNEPERLVGIISTEENIERIKKWCKQYKIDPKKVFTHKEFADYCKKTMHASQEKE